ncbi:hypothetical protein [Mycoavidus cysteinexigens]|nr:hypothetical protein [Mycoavidus cysteinexigens]GAM52936.1 hypothetical protein EBME_1399 [bacterium endosymbiont of Mortierella elongata FMR23-6]
MQIPSSLTSLISSWLPNLWDTETKAKNKQIPDLCGLSLDQVLHIYKDEGFCPARTVSEGPPSPFIRELEQNSFQQKQLTSSIFNYMGSTTANLNRISARLDKLEPIVLEKVLPICVLFLLFSVSANLFLLRKMNGMQAKQAQKSKGDLKNLEENLESKFKKDLDELKANLEKSLNEKTDNLQSTLSELKTSQSTQNATLTTSIETVSNFTEVNRGNISVQNGRIDGVILQIKGVQNDLTKTENRISSIEGRLPKPNSDLEKAQATQFIQQTTEISELRGKLTALEDNQKEFSITAAEVDNATGGEIDKLKEICKTLGRLVQNILNSQRERNQAIPILQETGDNQLTDEQWLNNMIEEISLPRSRRSSWGSWSGSQQSLTPPSQ